MGRRNVEIVCNAPPLPIVQACANIGIKTPEDVRWIEKGKCSCGHELGKLSGNRFTYSSGDEVVYAVWQCPCCKTVYWEKR